MSAGCELAYAEFGGVTRDIHTLEPQTVISASPTLPRYDAAELRVFMAAVLARLGAHEDAAATAEALVHADLRGVDSHGINMLTDNRSYVPGLRDGSVNARPNRRILHQTPSTALLDNDLGLGAAGATAGMQLAIAKARQVGSGWVAVTNGRHYGMAAHYPLQAISEGMIGVSVCNSRPYVAPAYGAAAMLGTNPIAFAAPAGQEAPLILDMATSGVAVGKLILARRTGKRIPRTWAQDAEGGATEDPAAVWAGGWLLPLGGLPETGGYKGYGLAAMVDVLAGVLSGIGTSPMLTQVEGVGQFFGAIRVDSFRPREAFEAMMDRAIREWRATPPLDPAHPVLVPGDPERHIELDRRARGIPLHPALVADLEALGIELGEPFPRSTQESVRERE